MVDWLVRGGLGAGRVGVWGRRVGCFSLAGVAAVKGVLFDVLLQVSIFLTVFLYVRSIQACESRSELFL